MGKRHRGKTRFFLLAIWITTMQAAAPASAHHSYAMFDLNNTTAVQGTVAKVEWVNPHVFLWLYVPKPDAPDTWDLHAIEAGPIGILRRFGWQKDTIKPGEKLSVLYFPLRDGRPGGSFIKAVRTDGSEQLGDPHAPGVARVLENNIPLEAPVP